MKTRFHSLLQEKVEAEIETNKDALVDGQGSMDFTRGAIYGLRVSLKLCEEIEREADERSNSGSGN